MSAERIAEIEARVNAATAGPWEWYDQSSLVAESREAIIGYVHDDVFVIGDSDGEFIEHARSDIPWLLEQLHAAETKIERDALAARIEAVRALALEMSDGVSPECTGFGDRVIGLLSDTSDSGGL